MDPSDAFSRAESLISGRNFRIVHRVRDATLEATGMRDLNVLLFAVLVVGSFGSILYTVRAWYLPWFPISFSFTLVFSVMLLIAYFTAPLNRIYLDIVTNGEGRHTASMTATGPYAASLMESMKSAMLPAHQDEISKGSQRGRVREESHPQ